MMSLRTTFLCFVIASLSAACSQSVSSPTPSTPPSSTTSTYGLTGQVVQAGTTSGIGFATVVLVDSSGNVLTTTTDASGAFAFGATLASGAYTLQVAAPTYATSTSSIAIPVTNFTVQLLPSRATPVTTTLAVIVGGPTTLRVGSTSQLTATVVYTDGTRKDVTNVAKWASTAPSVATVSGSGVMTAYSAGATTITANFQDVSGTLVTTISP